MRKLAFLLFVCVVGTAVLVSLGKWQLNRLDWKKAILFEIEQRMTSEAGIIPVKPVPEQDKYKPIHAIGLLGGKHLRVLSSKKHVGPGYRIISVFETNNRRVMLDRGFIGIEENFTKDNGTLIEIEGNIHWPDEKDLFTPQPDLENNIWFARDVDSMAQFLDTDPVLIVASVIRPNNTHISTTRIDATSIPNNHLQYAITWFSLAGIWVAMSIAFFWKTNSSYSERGK